MTARIRQQVGLGLFPDRFTMLMLHKPDGSPLTFESYGKAQQFIASHKLGHRVSPVEFTEDRDLDAMHIRHAVQEVLQRLHTTTPRQD